MRLLLHVLSDDLRTLLLSHWLDARSLAMLDVAISSKSLLDDAPWISEI